MIEAVMLWNEPNNMSHWDRTLDPDWDLFAEMVCLAGERLARVAPGLPRVLGGISPIDPMFVRNLFSKGVGQAVDVVAVHGFPFDWNRWHVDEWPARLEAMREAAWGKPVWATEVGVSSLAAEVVQAWGLDRTVEVLRPQVERLYWYALMDLPEEWEAVTRHRGSEGSAYFRHFRMGVYRADGSPKLAAERLRSHLANLEESQVLGVCEWVYWQEPRRLEMMVERLKRLGIRKVRTGLGWADWDRPGAVEWFDQAMAALADFDVTLTLCFTPERAARSPHHTSPPINLVDFADFCEGIVRRYATSESARLTSLGV